MTVILYDSWDPEQKKWISEKVPTIQDASKVIKDNMLEIGLDDINGTITVNFHHRDPVIARDVVNYYLTELSETLRGEVLQEAAENMRFFNEQLDQINDPLLREKIYTLLAKEIEKETFAKAQKYYSFQVLDPPIVSDMNKKVKPKRARICIIFVLFAFFIAVFLSFLSEYIKNLKKKDPQRYKMLSKEFKLSRNNKNRQS